MQQIFFLLMSIVNNLMNWKKKTPTKKPAALDGSYMQFGHLMLSDDVEKFLSKWTLTQLQSHSMKLEQLELAYKLTVYVSAKLPNHEFSEDRQFE